MNNNTREAIKDFVDSVELLTSAVLLTVGQETASEIITACEKLKRQLDKDKTILS